MVSLYLFLYFRYYMVNKQYIAGETIAFGDDGCQWGVSYYLLHNYMHSTHDIQNNNVATWNEKQKKIIENIMYENKCFTT
jgi:hypothetical protein